MTPLAAQRPVTIRHDLDPCDGYILADRQRLRQVLLNLISNAIKYNLTGGTVHITCSTVAGTDLRISVTDTGPGIAPDKLGRLFVAFDRLGAETSHVEGTGLGLALSKHLIEAMGGAIGIESTVDVGSTFWIELPLTQAPPQPPEEVSIEAGATRDQLAGQRSVLYIEDNLANLRLVERILSRHPEVQLLAAMQGRLGLQLARDHHPDLILLDLHLPDMPGQDVLRELKADRATRDMPVVVLSADATHGQVTRLLKAGAHAYLTKPINVKEFLDLLELLFSDAT
jgi:CheY-like chemotaxis protein